MATWAYTTIPSATFTHEEPGHSHIVATAGLYYGFGCFNYSGGEQLQTIAPTWTKEIII